MKFEFETKKTNAYICNRVNTNSIVDIEKSMNDYYSLFWNFVILVRYTQMKHKKCANVKTLISIDRFIQLNFDCNICRTHLRRLYFQHFFITIVCDFCSCTYFIEFSLKLSCKLSQRCNSFNDAYFEVFSTMRYLKLSNKFFQCDKIMHRREKCRNERIEIE